MRGKLIDLSSSLRYKGVPVSIPESIEAANLLSLYDNPNESNKEEIRMVLFSCMLKSEKDLPIFKNQFEEWWIRWFGVRKEEERIPLNALTKSLHKAIYRGDRKSIENTVHNAVQQGRMSNSEDGDGEGESGNSGQSQSRQGNGVSPIQSPQSDRQLYDRLRNILQLDRLTMEVEQDQEMGMWQRTNTRNSIKKAEAELRKLIFNAPPVNSKSRNIMVAQETEEDISDISIARANFVELKKMEELVPEIVRKLSHRRHYIKDDQRGILQFRKTMRSSLRNGGIPMEIVFKRKAPKRERIALLCDLSLSVENFSVFSLQLAHCFSSQFAGVRSFGFISDIDDITWHVSRSDFRQSLPELYRDSKLVSHTSNSDYGNVLRSFVRKYLPEMGQSTTVLVVGDARSNGSDPAISEMKNIRSQVKEIHWLNPEPVSSWGTGDSVIRHYEKYCDSVNHIRTVKDLAVFLADLQR
ncbi:VWA domain-containing protein [Bacillus dakarensis]|uniref:VWA domain-containing protein n=1 Tax=Robertmurraya dakarensis TaxID=1926278 RepID=UPI000980BD8F|nr:VWA domain-containing protein [Bacillus dakarensis]